MPTETGWRLDHVIGAQGGVSIRVPSGGVTVQGIDGETARLSSPSGNDLNDDYEIETADGLLELRAREGRSSGFGLLTGRRFDPLHVEVPRGAVVRLETASGSVHGDGLRGEQYYRAASGSVKLTDVSGDITVDHVSGDVKIRGTGPLRLTARTVSGDVNASAPVFEKFQARTMSGDVRLAGRFVGDGPFAFESVSGDVSVELDGAARIEGVSVAGRIRTDLPHRSGGSPGRRSVEIGDDGPRVMFKTVSGDLRVTRPKARTPDPDAPPEASAEPGGVPTGPLAAPVEPATPTLAIPPVPPIPPIAPIAPLAPPAPPVDAAASAATVETLASRRMTVLHDLENGTIEVTEAADRLAAIDAEEDRMRGEPRVAGGGPYSEMRWDHRA